MTKFEKILSAKDLQQRGIKVVYFPNRIKAVDVGTPEKPNIRYVPYGVPFSVNMFTEFKRYVRTAGDALVWHEWIEETCQFEKTANFTAKLAERWTKEEILPMITVPFDLDDDEAAKQRDAIFKSMTLDNCKFDHASAATPPAFDWAAAFQRLENQFQELKDEYKELKDLIVAHLPRLVARVDDPAPVMTLPLDLQQEEEQEESDDEEADPSFTVTEGNKRSSTQQAIGAFTKRGK
ncbi:hypothetical protein EDD86DRAFT_218368 [Gorgonomyces haynaldii]|nr:hypothetical protein EDD86DRAFT_221053 [Gorgonomyces haynaldii]KAI8903646.1 hypothetical protein EDD86DRAFT_250363 [Gorgonomyces haynaldii]KAI8903886.1 hypothetical protein EDD86DRAFT_260972 [Gorgonomyces haynaldii]KAI8903888.1 hypothetical protein EDD86DRAFT_250200 [Gorgonomyces haynaldii]KAI8910496.1 hypothetical protein EDD86DRAFT_218368 [Gorgonomyces haynaldii]